MMFKSLDNDAARMHPTLCDMLLQFRKPGENLFPIHAGQSEKYGNMAGWVTPEEWILWARPVWYAADYQPDGAVKLSSAFVKRTCAMSAGTSAVGFRAAACCPLQLDVIEGCVKVWSALGRNRLLDHSLAWEFRGRGCAARGAQVHRCGAEARVLGDRPPQPAEQLLRR